MLQPPAVATREAPPEPCCVPRFQLLVEDLGAAPVARDAAALPVLEVPSGVSHLDLGAEPLALAPHAPAKPALALEPIEATATAGVRSRLVLLTPPELRLCLNGLPLPAVALLVVGDQLQLDTRAILHVTEVREAGASAPSPALVGSPCGVCRLPLTADTAVLICGCGLPLHLEGPPKPKGERLECALIGDCPSCGAEIKPDGGPVWLPEL